MLLRMGLILRQATEMGSKSRSFYRISVSLIPFSYPCCCHRFYSQAWLILRCSSYTIDFKEVVHTSPQRLSSAHRLVPSTPAATIISVLKRS
jgi:hypothetical protein